MLNLWNQDAFLNSYLNNQNPSTSLSTFCLIRIKERFDVDRQLHNFILIIINWIDTILQNVVSKICYLPNWFMHSSLDSYTKMFTDNWLCLDGTSFCTSSYDFSFVCSTQSDTLSFLFLHSLCLGPLPRWNSLLAMEFWHYWTKSKTYFFKAKEILFNSK